MMIFWIPFLVINVLAAGVLHGCESEYGEPIKLPLILWIIWALIALLPIINIIVGLVIVIIIIVALLNGELRFRDMDHGLFKKY